MLVLLSLCCLEVQLHARRITQHITVHEVMESFHKHNMDKYNELTSQLLENHDVDKILSLADKLSEIDTVEAQNEASRWANSNVSNRWLSKGSVQTEKTLRIAEKISRSNTATALGYAAQLIDNMLGKGLISKNQIDRLLDLANRLKRAGNPDNESNAAFLYTFMFEQGLISKDQAVNEVVNIIDKMKQRAKKNSQTASSLSRHILVDRGLMPKDQKDMN